MGQWDDLVVEEVEFPLAPEAGRVSTKPALTMGKQELLGQALVPLSEDMPMSNGMDDVAGLHDVSKDYRCTKRVIVLVGNTGVN